MRNFRYANSESGRGRGNADNLYMEYCSRCGASDNAAIDRHPQCFCLPKSVNPLSFWFHFVLADALPCALCERVTSQNNCHPTKRLIDSSRGSKLECAFLFLFHFNARINRRRTVVCFVADAVRRGATGECSRLLPVLRLPSNGGGKIQSDWTRRNVIVTRTIKLRWTEEMIEHWGLKPLCDAIFFFHYSSLDCFAELSACQAYAPAQDQIVGEGIKMVISRHRLAWFISIEKKTSDCLHAAVAAASHTHASIGCEVDFHVVFVCATRE